MGNVLTFGALAAHDAAKEQRRAMERMQAEAEKNKVKPTIVDDSRQQEERRKRNALKKGSASTILAGDYRQSAVKTPFRRVKQWIRGNKRNMTN